MPKTQPFYRTCSSENCGTVQNHVLNAYDRKAQKKPVEHMKGGVEATVLEPAHVTIRGEQPKEYIVTQHGLGVQFRRCYEFDYINKHSHEPESRTCTKKLFVNIPQRTINCYNDVSELLRQMRRGKKGKPAKLNYKIIALVACSKSGVAPTRVSEPMSPSIVAAAIGASQYDVRKTMEQMIKTRKLVTDRNLDIINEKQVRLPPKYQNAFDKFVKGEKAERSRSAINLIFGKGTVSTSPDLPEAESFFVGRGFKPKKISKKAKARFERETAEWKARTGLGAWKPPKIKKAPKRKEPERYDLEQALGVHL